MTVMLLPGIADIIFNVTAGGQAAETVGSWADIRKASFLISLLLCGGGRKNCSRQAVRK